MSYSSAGECIPLRNKMDLDFSIKICSAQYNLTDGFKISGKNTVLDCDNSIIVGKGSGKGVSVTGSNNVMKNCVIDKYATGVYTEDSNLVIESSTIQNNINGLVISAENNNVEERNVNYINNVNDKTFIAPGKIIEQTEVKPNDSSQAIEKIVISEEDQTQAAPFVPDISNSILVNPKESPIPIRESDFKIASQSVDVEKSKTFSNGKTNYKITVIGNKDAEAIVVYEYFPKSSVSNANLVSSKTPFVVVEEDPVIKFEVGKVKKGQEKTVEYQVNKEVTREEPLTIVTKEQYGNGIKTLFLSSVFLYLSLFYIGSKVKKRFKKRISFIKKLLEKGNSIASIKAKLIKSGLDEQSANKLIYLSGEEKITFEIKDFFNNFTKFLDKALLIPYLALFGIQDLNFAILPSENSALILFIIVNIILALLIVGKVVLWIKWRDIED